jgi:proteasome lid subunit RPN8/RPN11
MQDLYSNQTYLLDKRAEIYLNEILPFVNIPISKMRGIEELAKDNLDIEICGLWTKDSQVTREHNFSDTPGESFTFLPSVFDEILGKNNPESENMFSGIYHSHPHEHQSSYLSPADIQLAKTVRKSIAVYHPLNETWDVFSPGIPHPYPIALLKKDKFKLNIEWFLGWQYHPYRADCFRLIEYFYKAILGLILLEIPRFDTDYEKPTHWNRFIDESEYYGFYELNAHKDGLQTGDIVLLCVGTKNQHPNHAGVIITNDTTGEYYILHLYNEKHPSEAVPLNKYRNIIHSFYRHKKVKL